MNVILVGGFHEIIEVCYNNNYIIKGIIDYNRNPHYPEIKLLGDDKNADELIRKTNGSYLIISPDLPKVRKDLSMLYDKLGYSFTSLISNKANISVSANIGQGTVIMNGVNVSANTVIGKFVRLNVMCNIMHDSVLGDYVTIAPNAVILGNVLVGNESYVGANSTILPNIKIGKNVVVGAGSVVTKDIPDNVTVIGVPAKIKESE